MLLMFRDPLIDPGERLILSVIGARSFFTLLGELSNFLLKVLAIFCLFSDYIFRTRLLHRFIMKRILNSMGLENFNFFLLDHCQREIGTGDFFMLIQKSNMIWMFVN